MMRLRTHRRPGPEADGPVWLSRAAPCVAAVALLAAVLLPAAVSTGCGAAGDGAESAAAPPSSSARPHEGAPAPPAWLSSYGFPARADDSSLYLFYLHGMVVEDRGVTAVDPMYGRYEYRAILETLTDRGFTVVSEQRPPGTDVTAYAQRVALQVRSLLEAGVPARHIAVVGASKGAVIAASVSALLDEQGVSYVLLGSDGPRVAQAFAAAGWSLHGDVLAIRDASDVRAGPMQRLFDLSRGSRLGRHDEIVVDVGLGHGLLYGPHAAWVDPAVLWARHGR